MFSNNKKKTLFSPTPSDYDEEIGYDQMPLLVLLILILFVALAIYAIHFFYLRILLSVYS
jgi:hypothetical protein